ncbi:MAG: type VI secretion system Vgr family protein [Inhella sp.]
MGVGVCSALGSALPLGAWAEREAFNQPWSLELVCLSENPLLDLDAILGQRLRLFTRLADGSEGVRSALVLSIEAEEADGGLARYRLLLGSWLSLLGYGQHSQVWQEQPLTTLLDAVFGAYAPQAQWRYADCVEPHLAQSPWTTAEGLRPYVVQHRQSDLAFVQRLLREEGLVLRFERESDTVVILADSPSEAACPDLGPVRFHRDNPTETSDTVQALGQARFIPTWLLSGVASQPAAASVVAAEVPLISQSTLGEAAPRLEHYAHLGEHSWGVGFEGQGRNQLDRALTLAQEGWEVQHKRFIGRSTVRHFAVGQRFELLNSPLDVQSAEARDKTLLLSAIAHVGLNNLPKALSDELAARGWAHRRADALPAWVGPELRRQVAQNGYANRFSCARVDIPWRPAWWALGVDAAPIDEPDDELIPLLEAIHRPAGTALHPKAPCPGVLSATVVDERGSAEPRDARVVGDAMGRIRIRYDFQGLPQFANTSASSVWVRVQQSWTGAFGGAQFIPRLGQQVLVDFINGDIEQPQVIGALYDGRGEGALPATPGGLAGEEDRKPYALSTDHSPSSQGNLTQGHAPAWHGGSPEALESEGQRNASAMSGFKSQEWDGATGYNQLVLDDSDGQLRVQLHSSAHSSQLNLGHLIHQADNHRGSFRGEGFELRSDAYVSLRAGQGMLLSTAPTQAQEPAGDNAPGIAIAKQLKQLGQVLSQSATTHLVPPLMAHLGTVKSGFSVQTEKEAPTHALLTALKGLVDGTAWDEALKDAQQRNTGGDKLPHTVAPVIAFQGQGGITEVAGQDHIQAAGHTITEAAGEDFEQAVGGDYRLHTGQAIGILAGAIAPGSGATASGLNLIAGHKDITIQAQSDTLQVNAQKQLTVGSQTQHIDWAAAKKITLATSGGACIVIQAGKIDVIAPGTITVKAALKDMIAAATVGYPMPKLPAQPIEPRDLNFEIAIKDLPGPAGLGVAGRPWEIVRLQPGIAAIEDPVQRCAAFVDPASRIEVFFSGLTDASGKVVLSAEQRKQLMRHVGAFAGDVCLVYGLECVPLVLGRHSNADPLAAEVTRIMAARNYAPRFAEMDMHEEQELRRWAETDYGSKVLGKPKSETDL